MPPTGYVSPPVASDRGVAAKEWLERCGIVARVPAIRSSDLTMIADPFTYYLTRRLGLTSAMAYSEALVRGSWFHTRLELLGQDNASARSAFTAKVTQRLEEIRELGKALTIHPDTIRDMCLRETQDALTALGWFEAAMDVRGEPGTLMEKGFADAVLKPNLQCVGTEVVLVYNHPDFPGTPLVIQIDRLLLRRDTGELIIFDAKTCQSSANDRLASCPVEWQSRHYVYVLNALLSSPESRQELINTFGLPANVRVGGVMHAAFAKPTIRFGMNDRAYTYASEGKRTGKKGWLLPHGSRWKLVVESEDHSWEALHDTEDAGVAALHEHTGKKPDKVYDGEPSLDRYIARVRDWYLGTGDYSEIAEERRKQPPVVLSFIPAKEVLDAHAVIEYTAMLTLVHTYATCEPLPYNFPRQAGGMYTYGNKLSSLAPFYVTPVANWPNIVKQEKFIQRWRPFDPVDEPAPAVSP